MTPIGPMLQQPKLAYDRLDPGTKRQVQSQGTKLAGHVYRAWEKGEIQAAAQQLGEIGSLAVQDVVAYFSPPGPASQNLAKVAPLSALELSLEVDQAYATDEKFRQLTAVSDVDLEAIDRLLSAASALHLSQKVPPQK